MCAVTVRHGGLVGCDVLTLVRVFEEGSCHQQPIPLSLHTRTNEQDNTVSVCELEVGLDSRIDLAEVLQQVVAPAAAVWRQRGSGGQIERVHLCNAPDAK